MVAHLALPGAEGGHVPDGLIYGPVRSRRFGTSLGVSFSLPGDVGCRWACPYCQLGGGSGLIRQDLMADGDAILSALRQRLQQCHRSVDAVTIAGAGEPMDHPCAADLFRRCRELCGEYGVPLYVLTNGDGLVDPAIRAQLLACDGVYVKWDPGPQAGCWARRGPQMEGDRFALLRGWPQLRLQSTVFRMANGGPGNSAATSRSAYIDAISQLKPCEVQLMTAERQSANAPTAPVIREHLDRWAAAIRRALPECQVRVYAA